MPRIFLPLTDEEFTTIKESADAKQVAITSLVREALGLPVAKRGRPAKNPIHDATKGIAKDGKE